MGTQSKIETNEAEQTLLQRSKAGTQLFIHEVASRCSSIAEWRLFAQSTAIGGLSGVGSALVMTKPRTLADAASFLALAPRKFFTSSYIQGWDAGFRVPFRTPDYRRGNLAAFYTHSALCGATVSVAAEALSMALNRPHVASWAHIAAAGAIGCMSWDTFFHNTRFALGHAARKGATLPPLLASVVALTAGGMGATVASKSAGLGMHRYYSARVTRGSEVHGPRLASWSSVMGMPHDSRPRDWLRKATTEAVGSAAYFVVFGIASHAMERYSAQLARRSAEKNEELKKDE